SNCCGSCSRRRGISPSRCPFHTRLWSFLATWTSKPISAPSLTGRYWISAWPLTPASRVLAARGLVILPHRHPPIDRPRHDSGLVADPRQPAQRPRHRGWPAPRATPDNGLTIGGLPSGRRAPQRALPAVGVVQVLEDRQFPANIKHRNPHARG